MIAFCRCLASSSSYYAHAGKLRKLPTPTHTHTHEQFNCISMICIALNIYSYSSWSLIALCVLFAPSGAFLVIQQSIFHDSSAIFCSVTRCVASVIVRFIPESKFPSTFFFFCCTTTFSPLKSSIPYISSRTLWNIQRTSNQHPMLLV